MKRLLIKASGITNPIWRGYNSGVGRSTYLLLDSFSKISNLPFELMVYVNGVSSLNFKFYNWPFKHYRFPIPEKFGCKMTKIEALYRTLLMKNDLLHIPHNLDTVLPKEKYVVTLHDVIGYDQAKQNEDKRLIKHWEYMAKNAVGVMTCSNFSKMEIVNKLKVDSRKVTVAYWGVSHDKFHIENHEWIKNKLHSLGICFPYFLSVSCAHPRKNMRILLKAYKNFIENKHEHRLILVWSNPPKDLLQIYAKEIANHQIIFLDYISDDDLLALYNGATCTMYPTRSEGFGFPILESFACGTPVMTCKNTSLTEIGKDVAIYVGEDNIDEMVAVMKAFENNSYDMDNFSKKSRSLVENFSWENTVNKYIDFYNKYL